MIFHKGLNTNRQIQKESRSFFFQEIRNFQFWFWVNSSFSPESPCSQVGTFQWPRKYWDYVTLLNFTGILNYVLLLRYRQRVREAKLKVVIYYKRKIPGKKTVDPHCITDLPFCSVQYPYSTSVHLPSGIYLKITLAHNCHTCPG